MSFAGNIFDSVKASFARDFGIAALKTLIVVWAIMVILVTLFVVNNRFVLAGILAYEVLP